MTAPNPKNVRIRLEIDVPTAAAGEFDEDGLTQERYVSTDPPANGLVCVRPVSGSLLGTFAFRVGYLFPYPIDVRALGYPDSIYPGFLSSSPYPAGVVAGKKVSPGAWEWNDAHGNRVPGADHNSTGVINKVTIWRDYGFGLKFDGAVTVRGVTEGLGSCSGSGSGSAMGGMEELSAAEVLMISVPDGPNHGKHYAKRHSGQWNAEVRKEPWVISSDHSGNLAVRVGRRVVSCRAMSFNPFSATFPGEAFGARSDVVVTVV